MKVKTFTGSETAKVDKRVNDWLAQSGINSSPHAHPADMVSLLPKREGGDAAINFPDAPGTYDLLISKSRRVECNDQNSAGRYPLISRPMHTSTSVGVVHDMSALPLWLWEKDLY